MTQTTATPDQTQPPARGRTVETPMFTDPHRRGDVTRDDAHAFPTLTDDQIDRAKRFGEIQSLAKGAQLFKRGDRMVDFFICLQGNINIVDDTACSASGEPLNKVITVHHERQFTGELDLFNRREILVSGQMACDGVVLRICRRRFRRLLSAEPDIANVITRAFIERRLGLLDHSQGGVKVIAHRETPGLIKIKQFLRRNKHPMRLLLLGDDFATYEHADKLRELLREHELLKGDAIDESKLPIVVCPGETPKVLVNPSLAKVGACLGMTESPCPETQYDVTVVGAGPAGLAAAVYAASEGLSTLILESEAPGGQAGTSSRIENYLGFPLGVSGGELAGRAELQAQKFGATLSMPRNATHLERCEVGYKLHLDEGPPVRTRSVVLACGARWRTLGLENFEKFAGSGIHYAATAIEAEFCRDSDVVVVGGGNSAGQAAVFLSGYAKCVHMLVRGENLADSMSDYLVQRIEASEHICLHTQCELCDLKGDGWLRELAWNDAKTGERVVQPIEQLFLMIGAVPNTEWLQDSLCLDDHGFIQTGAIVTEPHELGPNAGCSAWPLERRPHALETSLPGVFAVGDVRSTSVKRVASAVGEGSICVADVHRVLSDQRQHERQLQGAS